MMYDVKNACSDFDEKLNEYVLSNAQQRIWIQQQLNKYLTAYNLPKLIYFDHAVDITALENALNCMIQRHDALRTIIKEHNGVARQMIQDYSPIKIVITDLSADFDNGILQHHLNQNNLHVFDMSKQLYMFQLYKLHETSYVLYMSFHHIIYDGLSQKIFDKEFMLLYHSYADKTQPQLPDIKKQHIEWIYEQKQWMLSDECAKMQNYWLDEVCAPIPKLELPTDFTRLKSKSYEGEYVHASVQGVDILRQIAKKNNVSMHVLLLSIYFLLLHKLTQQDDIIVGIPYAERSDKDVENTIGVFINSLPIRTRFNQLTTFIDLLDYVNKKNFNAQINGKHPFDLLAEKVKAERNDALESIYSTLFQYYDLLPMENGSSLFDLSLLCRTNGNNLELRLNYCTDVLKNATVERYAHYYVNLVNCLLRHGAEIHLARMELMDNDEKRQVICTFNDTQASYDRHITLHQIFEHQTVKTPDSVAVIYGSHSYTYRQVNERANRLAYTLRQNAVADGSIVAIMMNRSVELIISILAILKAGGAYMPIDVEFPEERISYILRDSKTKWIVTRRGNSKKIDFDGILFYADDDGINTESTNPGCISDSSSIAYVMYTSGTTGTPKGVLVEHESVINRLLWMKKAYHLDAGHIFVQKTTYTFDVSAFELFIWFITGGKLCLLRPGEEKDPQALVEAINLNKITAIHFVPSMLHVFMQYVETYDVANKLKSLQAIFCSGEALRADHVELCRRVFQGSPLRVYNLYGPTEAAIDVTAYDCFTKWDEKNIPIGQPISNVRIYIVDGDRNILPIGVTGELCIAGDALARGYLNKPELTHEKFVIHPFTQEQNPFHKESVIYRTGDLAKWRNDGNIELLGRMDHQVKIRGYRIELDDIRNNLLKHEDINEVAVILNANEQLCVFYVAYKKLAIQNIKYFLSLLLPDYMVPTHYFQVDHIPLNRNGKIDLNVLSMISKEQEQKKPSIVVNQLQDDVRAIWAELLCVEKEAIRVDDRYFDIGGNSILLIKLHRLLMMKFGLEISILDLFTFNTIEKIERYIMAERECADDTRNRINDSRHTEYSEYIIDLGTIMESTTRDDSAIINHNFNTIVFSAFLTLMASLSGSMSLSVDRLSIRSEPNANAMSIDLNTISSFQSYSALVKDLQCDAAPYALFLAPIRWREGDVTVKPAFMNQETIQTSDASINILFYYNENEREKQVILCYNDEELSEHEIGTLITRYTKLLQAIISSV